MILDLQIINLSFLLTFRRSFYQPLDKQATNGSGSSLAFL
jgi:hypothetical protein